MIQLLKKGGGNRGVYEMKFSVVKSEIIFKEFFTIERARVLWEQFNGTMGKDRTRYVIRRGESVGIIPIRKQDDRIVLIKQFRYPSADRGFDGYIWEIPAGTLSPGEAAIACARRELIEETGYAARQWETLGEITPVPGYSNERIHVFLATHLSPAEQNLDKDEVLDVHKVKFEDTLKMIERMTGFNNPIHIRQQPIYRQ